MADATFNHKNIVSVVAFLEDVYEYYHRSEFIGTDPITYPRNAIAKGLPTHEVEYIAFLSAMFAYGNVKAIQRFLENLFNEYGTNPMAIRSGAIKANKHLYYRFQSSQDVANIISSVAGVYQDYGSLQGLMGSTGSQKLSTAGHMDNHMSSSEFGVMKGEFNNHFRRNTPLTSGVKMMFAQVDKSAAKRLSMFLRWMIRDDNIDMGLWRDYTPSVLAVPLDVHITQFSRRIGLLQTSNASKKNMDIVTDFFSRISPEDPVKYDFALTRPGIVRGCKFMFTRSEKVCYTCPQRTSCELIYDVCS